jgi:hypothetical protein
MDGGVCKLRFSSCGNASFTIELRSAGLRFILRRRWQAGFNEGRGSFVWQHIFHFREKFGSGIWLGETVESLKIESILKPIIVN